MSDDQTKTTVRLDDDALKTMREQPWIDEDATDAAVIRQTMHRTAAEHEQITPDNLPELVEEGVVDAVEETELANKDVDEEELAAEIERRLTPHLLTATAYAEAIVNALEAAEPLAVKMTEE